jgi:hypothetical protein
MGECLLWAIDWKLTKVGHTFCCRFCNKIGKNGDFFSPTLLVKLLTTLHYVTQCACILTYFSTCPPTRGWPPCSGSGSSCQATASSIGWPPTCPGIPLVKVTKALITQNPIFLSNCVMRQYPTKIGSILAVLVTVVRHGATQKLCLV